MASLDHGRVSRFQPGRVVSVVVVSLSAAYAVILLALVAVMSASIDRTEFGDSQTVQQMLAILAVGFLIVSLSVTTVVVTNTYSIITAGRVGDIARRRLLGSSARRERGLIARDGLLTGVGGAALGGAAGWGLSAITVRYAQDGGFLEPGEYNLLLPVLAVPLVVIVLCTWLAAWSGSRAVLQVNPIESLGVAAVQRGGAESSRRLGLSTIVLLVLGGGLLVGAAVLGQYNSYAVVPGILGGVLSILGVMMGAHKLVPAALALGDRLWPRSFSGLLAARNLQQHPARTGRAALGVLISVAVVTMFVVAVASFEPALRDTLSGTEQEATGMGILTMIIAVVTVLISVTAVISAIGMSNSVALNTRLRHREIGLMRVLGQTRRESVAVIFAESARLALGATVLGLVIGTVYGWVGLQSLIGSVAGIQWVPLVLPPVYVLVVLGCALLLTLGSALAPSRRALASAPIQAVTAAG